MSFLSYALGTLVLLFVLLRQVRAVPVPRVFQPRLPVFLGIFGLFSMFSYSRSQHVPTSAWGWVLGTLLVGAVGLGALRGLSMRVFAGNGWVLRQGTAVTMALWLVSLLVHFAADAQAGVAGLEGASLLLWLGLTLATQYYVVHRRAEPLYAQLGPDAGRPLRIDFSQGPGVFLTTFRTGPGPSAGWGAAATRSTADADVIDAEVIEDDDHTPPELPTAR
ncbi:MAG TPA: hypothetical protein VEG62_02085 [Acidimicrobiales bacterium]|nr:hypothetical protein [Acidimicrobiales bacterium]